MTLWLPYTQMQTAPRPIRVAKTHGVYWQLEDGRQLIDGIASWWTVCHGYNHPEILRQTQQQLLTMPHVMLGGATHAPAERLAERLAAITPGDLNHVFLSDSGSVAVEVAMKMAVQYWLNQRVHGKHQFVSFQNAYHGDTLGAMSVCDPVESMHREFQGVLLPQFHCPIPQNPDDARDLDRFLVRHRDQLAGVLIEPLVQGAGGMRFHSSDSLRMIAEATRRNGLLLIADEIATGFGRTGSMFACEQAEVVPDIICLGKALTAGTLGMAATIASTAVYEQFLSDRSEHALMHGPTFMANPLACAAANASLDLFATEPRLRQVAAIEQQIAEQLQACVQLPGVVDVRVRGAIGAIQVGSLHHLAELRASFVEHNVWLRPFRDIIYLTPPLTITAQQLDQLCEAVVNVVTDWSRAT